MNELETNEIANVGGGVIADRWGRGCTDPNHGKEPSKPAIEFPLMPEIEAW